MKHHHRPRILDKQSPTPRRLKLADELEQPAFETRRAVFIGAVGAAVTVIGAVGLTLGIARLALGVLRWMAVRL